MNIKEENLNRFISANSSEITNYSKDELKQSIKASEGRVILTETVATREAFIADITNSEIAAAFGSDLILLNAVDVLDPKLPGIKNQKDFVRELKKLTGRPIGVNLEPVNDDLELMSQRVEISKGRTVNEESLQKLNELGIDFVLLTGNPATGVNNESINKAIKQAREIFDGLIFAGKMHSSGVDEDITNKEVIEDFVESGVDVILVPSIGTIQGFDQKTLKKIVKFAHSKDVLVMSAIGTSQEGARPETIRQMAIENKICGVDIQHIGDAGYGGVAPVENIFEMSVAIRGIRHTISRIARSINR